MSEQQRVALVTGATSVLGEEFCRQLAARCEVIIAVACDLPGLQALPGKIGTAVELHAVQADLAGIEGVTRTLEVLRQKGPADILVFMGSAAPPGALCDVSLETQRRVLSLNCDAAVTLCRAAIPFMQASGGGSIINVASPDAFQPAQGRSVYGGSMAFLSYYSQVLQAEVGAAAIEVQLLCTGRVAGNGPESAGGPGAGAGRNPEDGAVDASQLVAASLSALGSGELFVIPEEGARALAVQGARDLLSALQGGSRRSRIPR